LIAGTGTKSGKTSLACKIIERFKYLDITAIKITPHFHETTSGLILKSADKGYSIYEETDKDTSKDTSRMLNAGASKVYFAKVWDDQLFNVFKKIMGYLSPGVPVICESPALRNFVEPGLFMIIDSNTVNKHKDINYLRKLPHVNIKLEELDNFKLVPLGFENGKWILSV